MSHQTVIMNGGESPLASKLKSRGAAPDYESQPSTAHVSPAEMDGGGAPTSGKTPAPAAAAPSDPSGVAGIGGIVAPRSKKS
jgi:hypothetical protein